MGLVGGTVPGRVGEPSPRLPSAPTSLAPCCTLVAKLFVICLPGGGFGDGSFLNFETMSNLSNHV